MASPRRSRQRITSAARSACRKACAALLRSAAPGLVPRPARPGCHGHCAPAGWNCRRAMAAPARPPMRPPGGSHNQDIRAENMLPSPFNRACLPLQGRQGCASPGAHPFGARPSGCAPRAASAPALDCLSATGKGSPRRRAHHPNGGLRPSFGSCQQKGGSPWVLYLSVPAVVRVLLPVLVPVVWCGLGGRCPPGRAGRPRRPAFSCRARHGQRPRRWRAAPPPWAGARGCAVGAQARQCGRLVACRCLPGRARWRCLLAYQHQPPAQPWGLRNVGGGRLAPASARRRCRH
jgi:hypothetical protein